MCLSLHCLSFPRPSTAFPLPFLDLSLPCLSSTFHRIITAFPRAFTAFPWPPTAFPRPSHRLSLPFLHKACPRKPSLRRSLHPTLPLARVSIGMEIECQQNNRTLADGPGLPKAGSAVGTTSRRREFCQFAGTPLFIPVETPAKVQGGCHQMTVSPTAIGTTMRVLPEKVSHGLQLHNPHGEPLLQL